jgi:dTDP-glucose 4,6-dehydratase
MNESGSGLLVTGGCGFIGSNFVREWLQHERGGLVNLDKLTYAGNTENLSAVAASPRYSFEHGDICDDERVRSLLLKHRPSAIVHFAAESHVDRSIYGPEAFVQTNVVGTLRLLHAATGYWTELRGSARDEFRFLHVSTDEVYGSLGDTDPPFTEQSPYAPNSPYAASKAASDHLVRAWHRTYGLPVVTANCSNNYGPYQFPEKFIPLLICNALALRPLPIYGNGLNVRDWLYVGDHCAALRLILASGRVGSTYNIGGAEEKTNLEVTELVCDLLEEKRPSRPGARYRDLISFVPDRPGHDHRYAIDAQRIRQELGWRPAETFVSGLRKTVDWYMENQTWLRNVQSGAYRDWLQKHYGNGKSE